LMRSADQMTRRLGEIETVVHSTIIRWFGKMRLLISILTKRHFIPTENSCSERFP
jgi:hypothetical protein